MATTIVLNGPSSAGKSSIGAALQLAWDGPLLVTGIDSFLAGFPEQLFSLPDENGLPGPATPGVHVVPGRGPAPSWIPSLGADGLLLMRAAHRAWRSVAETGLDQVVDHVLLEDAVRTDALEVLNGPDVLWVGVYCDVEELLRGRAPAGTGFAGSRPARGRRSTTAWPTTSWSTPPRRPLRRAQRRSSRRSDLPD